jgi:hypothetical protein
VDNINLSSGVLTPTESDIIVSPQLGINAAWPLTKLNTLRLHTTVGYTKYLSHPELDSSSLLFSPDSALSFDVYTGDFKINFHDQFSYQEDPAGQGALSNVSKFGRFTNTAGINVLWDLSDVILSLGFDHSNFITTGASKSASFTNEDTSSLDHSTDQVSGSAFLNLTPLIGAGVESVASLTSYPNAPQNDSRRVSAGPYLQMLITPYTKVFASGGIEQTFSQAQSGQPNVDSTASIQVNPFFSQQSGRSSNLRNVSGDSTSYYANLSVVHRLNRLYSDRLSIGHESQNGLFAQRSETTYVNYSSTWLLNPSITLGTTVFFEDVVESGTFAGLPYQRYGLTIGTGYRLTKNLSASISYEFTEKASSAAEQSYRQNRVAITASYQF